MFSVCKMLKQNQKNKNKKCDKKITTKLFVFRMNTINVLVLENILTFFLNFIGNEMTGFSFRFFIAHSEWRRRGFRGDCEKRTLICCFHNWYWFKFQWTFVLLIHYFFIKFLFLLFLDEKGLKLQAWSDIFLNIFFLQYNIYLCFFFKKVFKRKVLEEFQKLKWYRHLFNYSWQKQNQTIFILRAIF